MQHHGILPFKLRNQPRCVLIYQYNPILLMFLLQILLLKPCWPIASGAKSTAKQRTPPSNRNTCWNVRPLQNGKKPTNRSRRIASSKSLLQCCCHDWIQLGKLELTRSLPTPSSSLEARSHCSNTQLLKKLLLNLGIRHLIEK